MSYQFRAIFPTRTVPRRAPVDSVLNCDWIPLARELMQRQFVLKEFPTMVRVPYSSIRKNATMGIPQSSSTYKSLQHTFPYCTHDLQSLSSLFSGPAVPAIRFCGIQTLFCFCCPCPPCSARTAHGRDSWPVTGGR